MPIINYSRMNKSASQSGFTLIEVLVAALVLAIGILGMATMMLASLKSDQSAYYRSLASSYVYDMADRLRKNSAYARDNNAYDSIDTSSEAPAAPDCDDDNGCAPAERVAMDAREWASNFTNVNNLAVFHPALPNAVGTVTRGDGNLFTISVSWSETDWDDADPGQRKDNTTQSLSLNILL